MNNRFKPHKMNEASVIKVNNMKVDASILFATLEALPDCREKKLAIDRLDECVMWATKAVALNQVQM